MPTAVRFEANTEEEIHKHIKTYMYHYPYAGYMTTLDTLYFDSERQTWVAKMSRLKSCD